MLKCVGAEVSTCAVGCIVAVEDAVEDAVETGTGAAPSSAQAADARLNRTIDTNLRMPLSVQENPRNRDEEHWKENEGIFEIFS